MTDSAVASITIPTGCRPHKACSRDGTRPLLCHGYLRRRDDGWWLLATDSYIALALKVETTGDPQEGFVPRGVLKRIAKGRQAEQLSPTAWKVATRGGYSVFEELIAGDFPDFEKLGMWDDSSVATAKVGIAPALTIRLAEALGFPPSLGGLCLTFTGTSIRTSESPIRVTGGDHFPGHVGLQMPVRLDRINRS